MMRPSISRPIVKVTIYGETGISYVGAIRKLSEYMVVVRWSEVYFHYVKIKTIRNLRARYTTGWEAPAFIFN
jgi:sRNA-binding regulator protein Hfq